MHKAECLHITHNNMKSNLSPNRVDERFGMVLSFK